MPGVKNVREATTLPCWISRSCTNALFSNKKVASAHSLHAGPLALSLETVPHRRCACGRAFCCRGISPGKIRANSKERGLSTAYIATSKVLGPNAPYS